MDVPRCKPAPVPSVAGIGRKIAVVEVGLPDTDSWVDLASPPSRASVVSGGDNGSIILVDGDGAVVGTDTSAALASGGGGTGSPFSRLSIAVRYHIRSSQGRHSTGLGQRSKRTVEWLESYNSRPELHLGGPSPVQTEQSTPPNSLALGLDMGDLVSENDEISMASDDNRAYMCTCRKIPGGGPFEIVENGFWMYGSSSPGGGGGGGRRALLLCLVTNLVTLAIGVAIG
ncbi:unnamed protein product [Gongylonema pulchrum]|uniref:Uncharacterized protein n=1 Tax=Gongylonema pulchrum TaxID=637853 RepID=A0A183E4H2_9BILA|nr:unnamed protein product [Gongylonema pulchrum]